MITVVKNLVEYRELMAVLAWKNVTLRYKQAYLGIAWAVVKPLVLMLIFTLVRSFVGIDSGNIPYPLLTFAALMPWIFFQESASEGVSSVVSNANLIKKIYFPREIFPITAVVTKLVELGINFIILAGLMIWFQYDTQHIHAMGATHHSLYNSSSFKHRICRRSNQRLLPRCRDCPTRAAFSAHVYFSGDLPIATGEE